MPVIQAGWAMAGFILYLGGAVGCVLAVAWLLRRGDRTRPDRSAAIGALGLTAAWCVIVAALGSQDPAAVISESVRNLAWIFFLFRLFANDGRHQSLGPIRPVVAALAFVECLQPAVLLVNLNFAVTPELQIMTFKVSAMFRVLVAVGVLVLLHNLYGGASATMRHLLRWSAAAVAGLFAFDLNYYTIAYLAGSMPTEISVLRGLVVNLMAVPLAIGGNVAAAKIRFRPSRDVAFQTLSLLVIGAYLIVMVAISQSLDVLGGDFGRLTQVGFVLAAIVVALLWLPSRRMRGWLRVTAVKHLFQHRYDYRAEWLRFTRTIGHTGEGSEEDTHSLHQRVVKAVADITESPSGMLLLPADSGVFRAEAEWPGSALQWPEMEIPAQLASLLETRNYILDLDDVRSGKALHGEDEMIPQWLGEMGDAWALVPLLHFDRMLGIVLVTRPEVPRALDWEDFDLLRIVGQQLASYLAEQSSQQALMEAARFDEFNQRIAFVVHDIKNLASQLSLLAGNAERHAEKPEFRADMLVTLRNSADKLNTLLARLVRYNGDPSAQMRSANLLAISKRVALKFDGAHKVILTRTEPCSVLADPEALEQSLLHLVQNAVDASDAESPVFLEVSSDGLRGNVQVVDSGEGMEAAFVREELFRPFVSTKNGGFGIGAFEARELVKAMGGRLDADSRPGLGTRFTIDLPIAATADLPNDINLAPAKEVA